MVFKEDGNGIIRDELGRFVPGQSGNPEGRRPLSDTEQAKQDTTHLKDKALDQLEKALDKGRVWAVKEVLNRQYGTPSEHVNINTTNGNEFTDLTNEQVEALLADNGITNEADTAPDTSA